MLNIYVGSQEKAESNISGYFNSCFTNDWLNNEFAKTVIREIDKSEHIKDSYIESSVLGAISPRDLSSGCKALITLYNKPDLLVCGERFGDNCFKWLFELAKTKDITITLSHIPDLNFSFAAKILNTGTVVTNEYEFVNELYRCHKEDLIHYA